jgi:hypothetical protein
VPSIIDANRAPVMPAHRLTDNKYNIHTADKQSNSYTIDCFDQYHLYNNYSR